METSHRSGRSSLLQLGGDPGLQIRWGFPSSSTLPARVDWTVFFAVDLEASGPGSSRLSGNET